MAKTREIYKVMFRYNNALYERYAKKSTQSGFFGFFEISEFVFGKNTTLAADGEVKILPFSNYV